MELQSALQDGAGAIGFAGDPRPYRAHITLVRKVSRIAPECEVEPLCWPVSDFCLVRSEGGEYTVLERWPLESGGA